MNEELLQRNLLKNPEKIGKWYFYNIGNTTLNELKNAGIIPQKDYKDFKKRKPDGLIAINQKIIAVIENKSILKFKTKKQKESAIKQGIDVAEVLEAKILILTDTIETIWINVLNGKVILDANGIPLKDNFFPASQDTVKLLEQIIESIDENNSQLLEPPLKDPTKLAKSVWQDLWMAAGATPENCLYSFVELFIFKYLSDLGVLQGHRNYNFLMDLFKRESEQTVLEYYANEVRKYIKALFPVSTIDNTTIINGTIFVSKDDKAVEGYGTVFHRILEKFGDEKEGGGEFKNIDRDFKSKLFETFLKESISKKNWGQYFTPLKVVRAIVKMAESDIKEGITICDPACGVGKFLLEPLLINNNIEHFYKTKWVKNEKTGKDEKKLERKITLIGKDKGFDKEEQKTIILAKANMLIYMSEMIRKHCDITSEFAELFNDTFELKTKNILGTLRDIDYEGKINLILTNPPYVTTGSSNLKEEIIKSGIQEHYKINAMGVEGLFMEWIIRALKPGGKAFVVVPDGIFNRQNDKNLRQYILEQCIIDGIISLPLKTFFTTSKKTYILCMTKKIDSSQKQKSPVFTYLVSEIGESRDVHRFDIAHDDLSAAVSAFNQFKNAKDSYKSTNKRCKIQPIEQFDSENYWSIERWWSKEERIALGILDEDKAFTINEFSELVNDISETLREYSEILKEIGEKKKPVVNLQKLFLSNKKYFSLFIGKRLVKKDLIQIHGNIPLYSANVKKPIALYNKSNIGDYSNDFVIWGIDGDFEYNFIPRCMPFATTDHCGAIRILDTAILPEYLMLQLEKVKHLYGFDRGLRASLKNMQNVSIDMPFDEHGELDIAKQKEIVEKYKVVFNFKLKIIEYKEQVKALNIEFDNYFHDVSMYPLYELFDVEKGKAKYTKKYGYVNKGIYPVYSASNNLPLTYINTYDYDGAYLTWATNGFAGYMKLITGKFSINGDRGLLRPRKENINLIYVKSILEPKLRSLAKGRKGEKGEDEFTKVYPTMIQNIKVPIPLTKERFFDFITQTEIANSQEKIDQIKTYLIEELDKMVNILIDYV
jgi:type I restriction-modification system DNA methylase subunit